ncbi:hypothetical protein ES319_D09G136200v1 [Gossypium barbadense]|uniref:Uncharacterized protein n=1 Tax=Gossypium barbadense TaxID=3634 RepID=A0A5J5Q2Q9_GOSBA|nr:hypothetical protein ES319_D09G136200v1 [Gossypium barbadense]
MMVGTEIFGILLWGSTLFGDSDLAEQQFSWFAEAIDLNM